MEEKNEGLSFDSVPSLGESFISSFVSEAEIAVCRFSTMWGLVPLNPCRVVQRSAVYISSKVFIEHFLKVPGV